MYPAELWPPLLGLGDDAAQTERALGASSTEVVAALLDSLEARLAPASPVQLASLSAARFALALRSASAEVEALGRDAIDAFARADDDLGQDFLRVELASWLSSDKRRLGEALALLNAVQAPERSLSLQAALLRGRGVLARAEADLRGALSWLERSQERAVASGSAREQMRTANTLGTTYASIGLGGLAHEALSIARELAELLGQRQSAAIATGQLAVLAMDAGNPARAVRLLSAQRAACEQLGDVHGLARSLALLVEAYEAQHEPGLARDAAEQARALYARSPSPWTRFQAVMASVFEAEGAFASGDDERGAALLRSCRDELEGTSVAFRVARARSAFSLLWQARRSSSRDEARQAIDAALARLRHSPRPTWVERALTLASEVARAHQLRELVEPLLLRASSLIELRGAASASALRGLRQAAPEAAIARAMAMGRDLLLRAGLALAPLDPFEAELLVIETAREPCALDRALVALGSAEPARELDTSTLPPLVSLEGHHRALAAFWSAEAAADAEARLTAMTGIASLSRSAARLVVLCDPTMGLALACAAPDRTQSSGASDDRALRCAPCSSRSSSGRFATSSPSCSLHCGCGRGRALAHLARGFSSSSMARSSR